MNVPFNEQIHGGYTDIIININMIDGSGAGIDDVRQSIHNAESLLPWKLELGLSVTTDVIGLLHGVRFFVNLLPSYHDPVTDTDLFLHGMTLYL